MKIGYARVSTRDQNLELQLDALTHAGCELILRDIIGNFHVDGKSFTEHLNQLQQIIHLH